MAGIYLHIPFCKLACTYCNFHFSTSLKNRDAFLQALHKEIALENSSIAQENIETIYFGGGTPSILPLPAIAEILEALHKKFKVEAGAEITLEANPDDIDASTLEAWYNLGINRLSVGIQSFDAAELQWMNRAHTAEESVRCLELITASKIQNFSADLIYGSHLSGQEVLQRNLDTLLSFHVPHLSCYALTREERTAYNLQVQQKKTPSENEEAQAAAFAQVCSVLGSNGYEHYEISNFALPGNRSQHNSSYWQGKPYMGFGPAAHSFDGYKTRWWNVANNSLYIQSLANNTLPREQERLTDTDRLNEMIMISLRTSEGLNLEKLKQFFGEESYDAVMKRAQKFIAGGHLVSDSGTLILSASGKFMADGIAAELFK